LGLVEAAIKSDAKSVYVALDGPQSVETSRIQSKIIESLQNLRNETDTEILIVQREDNLGSGAGVINAINWFFSKEEAGVILEDDLVVENNFFSYMNQVVSLIDSDPKILFASGTRLRDNKSHTSSICSYPVVWGWATSREKWRIMSTLIFKETNRFDSKVSLSERVFWRTGKRRALKSQIDAWDIPLSAGMREKSYFSLVPPINLVSNVGFDDVASHTTTPNWPLQLRLDSQLPPQVEIDRSSAELSVNDELMRKRVFRISTKNIITGVISIWLDPFRFYGRRKKLNLVDRANQKFGITL
jgi:hypothetical protein